MQVNGLIIKSNKITFQNIPLESGDVELEEFTVIDYEVPLIDKDGQYLGLLMSVINITKRKQAEEERNKLIKALADSENKYRRVVQNLSEGVVMTNLEDNITFVNQQMCDLTGYTESELLGQKAYELLLPKKEWTVLRK